MPETIVTAVDQQVGILTLSRPDRYNAYTPQMGAELFGAMHAMDVDDGVRAIVVTGAGKHFCAGADLESGGDTFAGDDTWAVASVNERKVQPWNMRTPVIAALNGAAVGIGATLTLPWDIRIASTKARMGFVFTQRGISPEHHSTWILPKLIGTARAMELFLTGRIIDATKMLELGLVSEVVDPDRLVERALEVGREIARNTSPTAVAATKRLVWRQWLEAPLAAKQREDAVFHWCGKQADAAEGVTSFLEKRAPAWAPAELPAMLKDPL